MAKKLIFTLVWMLVGFVTTTLIALVIALVVPSGGSLDDHTSGGVRFAYAVFALLPFVGIGAGLLLGLLGKLPGTKIGGPK